MIKPNTGFLIVGMGLIGGCYAQALKQHGHTVLAIDTDRATCEYALANGLADRAVTTVEAGLEQGFFEAAETAVFGLYPTALIAWLEAYQAHLPSGMIFTDVSGIKHGIVEPIQAMLRPDLEFISCHPMAGKESSGIQNADCRIFAAANYIITPTERNSERAVEFARELGELLGFGRITELDTATHDRMIGFLSQLTHAIAVSLMTCNDDQNLQDYTGDSFRDLTRIAKINESMWTELFFLNKEILMDNITLFEDELTRLKNYLRSDDREGLKSMFRKSTERRKQFDK